MSQTNAEWLREFVEFMGSSARIEDAFIPSAETVERLRKVLTELERPTFEARVVLDDIGAISLDLSEVVSRGDWHARLGWTPQPGEVVQVTVRKRG